MYSIHCMHSFSLTGLPKYLKVNFENDGSDEKLA